MTAITDLREPPMVSGGTGPDGHLEELRNDPIALLHRVRDECGDVGTFRLAGRDVVLMTGADANEFFFRAPEEELDQAEAYPFMTPIFGEGVVFDAPPERGARCCTTRRCATSSCGATRRPSPMRSTTWWRDGTGAGDIDLLDFFAELTIYTSSSCLIGKKFRSQLDRRFAELYHDLERGTDALAYVDPYAPIESFRRRDEARVGLVELVGNDHGRPRRRGATATRTTRPPRRPHVDHRW